MSNLRKVDFSEFGEIITGKTPSSAYPEDFGDETPFVTPSDSFEQKYIDSTQRYLSPEGVKKLKGKLLPANSVLVTCIGSAMGKVAMVRSPSITNQQINAIKINGNFDPEYIYYCLKNNYKLLRNAAGGSTALPLLNKTEFELLSCNVHSEKDEQKKISSVLSSIDKKIELNNRINAELEAMAKTLYDYWFVQFDFPDDSPQGQGKPYKTSGGKMVYNPTLKREIPEGWSDGTLGEIAELYQPKTISEKEMTEDGEFLVYGANGIVGRYAQYNHEQSVVAVTCRGNSCGEINVTRPYSWITGNAMVVNTDSHLLPPTYIYNLLRSSGLENVITGSAQPQITRTNLAPMKIIRPAEKVLTNYAAFVKPNFEKRMAILDENEKLEKLRDWLLPMLMNGQVTVGEAS